VGYFKAEEVTYLQLEATPRLSAGRYQLLLLRLLWLWLLLLLLLLLLQLLSMFLYLCPQSL